MNKTISAKGTRITASTLYKWEKHKPIKVNKPVSHPPYDSRTTGCDQLLESSQLISYGCRTTSVRILNAVRLSQMIADDYRHVQFPCDFLAIY